MKEPADILEDFYLEYRQQLFTAALVVTGCADTAEDALHEAFTRLMSAGSIPAEGRRAYVFRSVRNAAIDKVRRRRPSESVAESVVDPSLTPRQIACDREFAERLVRALALLSDDEREVVVQRLHTDLTFREIAEIRAAPLGTVTAWYHRGITRLRQELED